MTKLTGIDVFKKRKYAIEEAIREKAIGTLSKKRTNRRIMGR
jgi:hypothetical protein